MKKNTYGKVTTEATTLINPWLQFNDNTQNDVKLNVLQHPSRHRQHL